VSWNYTTVLNIIALVGFAVLYWLYRNRERFGGGAGYAKDPVCGMQVETSAAPATAVHAGQRHYFCSDHCQHRFTADPGRHLRASATDVAAGAPDPRPSGGAAVDPVCGMSVDPATARASSATGTVTTSAPAVAATPSPPTTTPGRDEPAGHRPAEAPRRETEGPLMQTAHPHPLSSPELLNRCTVLSPRGCAVAVGAGLAQSHPLCSAGAARR